MKIKDSWKIDALVDEKKYASMYQDSINNNNNFVLTSQTQQATDVEGTLICEFKWNAEFKKK